jgi:hypothetical protein
MDLLLVFMKLRVMPFSTHLELKLSALTLYASRKELHKIFAPYAPLLLGRLTPPTFLLLCAAYDVPILLVEGPVFYTWGDPQHAVRNGAITPIFHTGHLFEVRLAKPLYAVSHYTLAELTAMAAQLGLEGRTKAVLYERIKEFVNLQLK